MKRHSILRMHQRGIGVDEVKHALMTGSVIEAYPGDQPFASYLVMGPSGKQENPLHIVVAIDEEDDILWVITAYRPDPAEWKDGFRRRKT